MSLDYISRKAATVIKKYDETEPLRLCRAMGIIDIYRPMGLDEGCCKGFYISQSRMQAIVINSDLPRILQRVIMAHELGHAVLHKNMDSLRAFHDFSMFDESTVYEYEANIFAAELLLPDEKVKNVLDDGASFFAAASMLNVPPEMLDFKFRTLRAKGIDIADPPIVSHGNFLKSI